MKRAASFRNIKKIDLHKFVPRMAQKGTSPGTVEYIGKTPSGDDWHHYDCL